MQVAESVDTLLLWCLVNLMLLLLVSCYASSSAILHLCLSKAVPVQSKAVK
ncbi:hypothetical protein PR003_g4963 [Phytophthora rubi]|uniref:Uncharacterized protein n=1 Tax=Phytophthora rubi TaxID=129364 RepID=A0A6A4G0R2_9STRA|nr:hypothetical protein PR002_g4919 [Phytophthora rubi]KAE9043808.1 hypothetical protein PR001_g5644 [Phytophthora rubi]KAE9351292.1 hypothetical protein PR003_g4963 [Phytophthora rubi]